MPEKILRCRDLVLWQKAIDLTDLVYRITEKFPRTELFGLALQMRKAAVSVPSNIAEGTRHRTPGYISRLIIALGEHAELETQAIIANRRGYIDRKEMNPKSRIPVPSTGRGRITSHNMGRKSSAKSQLRQAAGSPPANPEPTRRFPPLLIVATVGLLVALVAVVYVRSSGSSAPPQAEKTPAAAQQAPVEPPAAAKLGPHPQENLPPLPFSPEPPARPADVVRAAYTFAAEHPEVLSYVPCYCGCERSGHRGNEDCFVTARDANGDVTAWEPHGMT